MFVFFFQAEDGIRDTSVTGVQTCALPIYQVLIGRGDPNAPDTDLQWTLYTRSASEGWNGPLAAGIDHTVDLLSPQQGGSLAQAEATTRVRIEGVAGLADYAAVQRLLESVPGVRRANIAAAEANRAAC